MPSLNRVMLIGNLTRDPELRFMPNGTAIAEVGLAINHVYYTKEKEKREEVTFVDLTFFAKKAENLAAYTKKGQPLFVDGRLKLDSWEDKQSGQKRSKLSVVGETFEFLSSGKPEGGQAASRPAGDKPPTGKDPELDGDDLPY